MSTIKPASKRTGKRCSNKRHIRAVVDVAVHNEIRRLAIDRGVNLEDLYSEILGLGVKAARGQTLSPAVA